MGEFAVLIPVGPNESMGSLADTLDSLTAHEKPDVMHLVLVDDAPTPRQLKPKGEWRSVQIIRSGAWDQRRRPAFFDAMTAGTLAGMNQIPTDVDFALKLDVDAVAIGPFAEKLRAAIALQPRVGMFGSYAVSANGSRRDFTYWTRRLRVLSRPVVLRKRIAPVPNAKWREVRSYVQEAESMGHEIGAHCLGGAYAVSPALLRISNAFASSPWVGLGVSEDVVMGTICGAHGLGLADLTAPGEVFGLSHIGLPRPAEELVGDGYSIVHSVKDTVDQREDDLRHFFRSQREFA
jgi:hypothetical protein